MTGKPPSDASATPAFGHVRIAAAFAPTHIGNPHANADEIIRMLALEGVKASSIVLFPELCVTGYTCGDLFKQKVLLDAALAASERIAEHVPRQMVVVGLPVQVGNAIYDCAAVLNGGRIIGIVPKQFLPTYKEFYERRWFQAANGHEPATIEHPRGPIPFGADLLFKSGDVLAGIEICEDLWMPIPPSSFQALEGALILLNPSASNETVAKGDYRRDLVAVQSGRCIAAYAYASCGPTESTADIVMSGDLMIAENGVMLARGDQVGIGHTRPLEASVIVSEVDIEKLQFDRRVVSSFDDSIRPEKAFRRVEMDLEHRGATLAGGLARRYDGMPFVPSEAGKRDQRCAEVLDITCHALAKRFRGQPDGLRPVIGVSGGWDSTIALLVTCKAWDFLGRDRKQILGVTMPGFGTSARTKKSACDLMRSLGVGSQEIDIRAGVFRDMQEAGYRPFGIDLGGMSCQELDPAIRKLPVEQRKDVGFENYQARKRTFHLFGKGFVIGTGDMSEIALGWCTYNGDHMSNYNPNCSYPKTLVGWLIAYWAENLADDAEQTRILHRIFETVISPELLPTDEQGEIAQSTEAAIGPYSLHDFFLFHFIRNGFSPAKILFLARHAQFKDSYLRDVSYAEDMVRQTLRSFITRFFFAQFKRDCVPNGPKVGSVSLSPRGDWRMPSDADVALWLKELE